MTQKSPNIILVTTDQQRTDSLSCYGSTFTSTPHLDRLASEGLQFNRAYCANPTCTPARASLFSGLHTSRHGAWNVGTNIPDDLPMLPQMLQDAGYRTHAIGKLHFQAYGSKDSMENCDLWEQRYPDWQGPYYGFETVELALGHVTYGLRGHYGAWLKERTSEENYKRFQSARRLSKGPKFEGDAMDWDLPPELHNSVWTADRTIEFLETRPDDKPFFLSVGFQDPHHPHALPRDFEDRVRVGDVPAPRWVEGELDDKPPHHHLAHKGNLEGSPYRGDHFIGGQGPGADYSQADAGDARQGRAYYYSMVKLVDREMGRILDALEQQGLTENTLVIFTSDHGELLGDHGIWLKGPFPYEELVRIPLLMRFPREFSGRSPIDGLVSHVDIVPTILQLLDLPAPEALDGKNLLPLIKGQTAVNENVIVGCTDDPSCLRSKTVITKDRKLTFYHGHEFGELYDLSETPRETVNHWFDPKFASEKAELLSKLLDHSERLEHRAPRTCYA